MKNQFSTLSDEHQLANEEERACYLERGMGSSLEKNRSLMRFCSRQEFAKILAYTEIFKLTSGVCGSIAECGVFWGGGLGTYANLAASLEPYNYPCKIFGFDTFEGSTDISEADSISSVDFSNQKYIANNFEDLHEFIRLYNNNRPIGHLEKIKLIKGDLCSESKKFITENQEVIFRIIHLSVNLYEPTYNTLINFLPKLARGGIVAVHAVNYCSGPTQALLDAGKALGLHSTAPRLRTFEYYPNIVYFIND